MLRWFKHTFKERRPAVGVVVSSPGLTAFKRYAAGHLTLEEFRRVRVLSTVKRIVRNEDGSLEYED
jgi:hypothetical protein